MERFLVRVDAILQNIPFKITILANDFFTQSLLLEKKKSLFWKKTPKFLVKMFLDFSSVGFFS